MIQTFPSSNVTKIIIYINDVDLLVFHECMFKNQMHINTLLS